MGEINHGGAEKRGFLLNIYMYIKWAQLTFHSTRNQSDFTLYTSLVYTHVSVQ